MFTEEFFSGKNLVRVGGSAYWYLESYKMEIKTWNDMFMDEFDSSTWNIVQTIHKDGTCQ